MSTCDATTTVLSAINTIMWRLISMLSQYYNNSWSFRKKNCLKFCRLKIAVQAQHVWKNRLIVLLILCLWFLYIIVNDCIPASKNEHHWNSRVFKRERCWVLLGDVSLNNDSRYAPCSQSQLKDATVSVSEEFVTSGLKNTQKDSGKRKV